MGQIVIILYKLRYDGIREVSVAFGASKQESVFTVQRVGRKSNEELIPGKKFHISCQELPGQVSATTDAVGAWVEPGSVQIPPQEEARDSGIPASCPLPNSPSSRVDV